MEGFCVMDIDAARWALLILFAVSGYMLCVEVAADYREDDSQC